LNQLEAVQRDVAALLEHGLNPPAAPGPELTVAQTGISAGAEEVSSTAPENEAMAEAEPVAR
jgi:hypothetical protein